MTFPLLALGLLSLVGGWIGIPESFKGHNYFHHWLLPVLGAGHIVDESPKAHGIELLLALTSFLWVFHIGLITMILYSQKLNWIKSTVRHLDWVYRLVRNKYYIDEIYHWGLV